MTVGSFHCQECRYITFKGSISNFVRKCKKCGVEYDHLADVFGYHIVHSMPISKLSYLDYEDARLGGFIALARGSGKITYHIYDQGFGKYLENIRQKEIEEGKISIIYKDKKK